MQHAFIYILRITHNILHMSKRTSMECKYLPCNIPWNVEYYARSNYLTNIIGYALTPLEFQMLLTY